MIKLEIMHLLRITFLVSLLSLVSANTLRAEAVYDAHVRAELVSEVQSIQPGTAFWVGLNLQMDPGWHTYWKNPGDSGLATTIEWNLPEGFTAGPVEWPYPQTIFVDPLMTYAYENTVLLLTRIQTPHSLLPGTTVTLNAEAHWLACEKICIPGKGVFNITLPVRAEAPVPDPVLAPRFAEARARLPLNESPWQIDAFQEDNRIWIALSADASLQRHVSEVRFFPDRTEMIDHAAPQKLHRTSEKIYLELIRSRHAKDDLAQLDGILVSGQGWRGRDSEKSLAVSVPLQSGGALPAALNRPSGPTLPWALLFAFLGGMILNLMPCVLPVLSLKILNFVSHAAHGETHALRQGIVFSAGIVFSFWILAGLMLILRAGGEQIGWGFQLQSPVFVAVLAVLFFLFSLSLFGVFEAGHSLTGLGRFLSGDRGTPATFASGILAAIVSTPCTAPFMGTAMGFGLTQPPAISLLIFTALGAGMAFPYFLLSAFPSLLRFMPKPGAWMIRFKQILALLLLATVFWLVWLLSLHIRLNALAAGITLSLILTAAGAVAWGRIPYQAEKSSRRQWSMAAFLLIAAGLGIAVITARFTRYDLAAQTMKGDGIAWESYSAEIYEDMKSSSQPVFIDFTAAWCLSCQVNERLALSTKEVVELFRQRRIRAIKADWTQRDAEITQALARYGRSSIPLYVYYPRGTSSTPVLLPEIITPSIVLRTLSETESQSPTPDTRRKS